MTEIQEAVIRLREKGWTIAALSRELQVSPVTIYRWTRGFNPPREWHTRAILRELAALDERPVPRRWHRQHGHGQGKA